MLFSISRVAGKPSKSARQRSGRRWTIAELEKLGRLSDTELARKYGRTIKEVAAEREARRIGLDLGPRPWTERENKQSGKKPGSGRSAKTSPVERFGCAATAPVEDRGFSTTGRIQDVAAG